MEGDQTTKNKTTSNDDRISQLPDAVLGIILSCLPLRDAVRTSVLSARWRYFWTTSGLPNLSFDETISGETSLPSYDFSYPHVDASNKLSHLMERTQTFINCVSQFFLPLSFEHRIKKLKVCFKLRHWHGKHLDQWLSHAIARGVQEIDLCLSDKTYTACNVDDMDETTFFYFLDDQRTTAASKFYDFPCYLLLGDGSARNSSIRLLRLQQCSLAPEHSSFPCFKTLTTLELRWVNLKSDEYFQNLLCNCHLLERLSLHKCYRLHRLKIVHPLCRQLKYFKLCSREELSEIQIDGIDLETLEFKGSSTMKFSFTEVKNLKTATIRFTDMKIGDAAFWPFYRFPSCLPQLETLWLSYYFDWKAVSMPESLPTHCDLKHLAILEVFMPHLGLLWIRNVLMACPLLQKLELHLHNCVYIDEEAEINRPSGCGHDQLREVIITGSRGYISEVEIAVYLLNNAMVLEKMVIDPRTRYYEGYGRCEVTEACARRSAMRMQRLVEYLRGEVRPPVELLVL